MSFIFFETMSFIFEGGSFFETNNKLFVKRKQNEHLKISKKHQRPKALGTFPFVLLSFFLSFLS